MEVRFKNRIKGALRKLTWSWKPYSVVKNRAKVDKATYECNECGKYCYTGKSDKSLEDLQAKYPKKEVAKESIYIDHVDPVESVETGFVDWNTFIERLFCEEENLNPLCKSCHDIKSKEENKQRRKSKKK